MSKFSAEWFKAEVRRMDPNINPASKTFRAALVMLAALQEGACVRRLARFTGVQEREIRTWRNRLRKSGVWVGAKTACEWDDPTTGGVAFWIDVCVALGMLKRRANG